MDAPSLFEVLATLPDPRGKIGDVVSPLAVPDARIAVADVLPN